MNNDFTNELLALNEELGYTNAEGTTGAIIDCDDTIQIVGRDINMPANTICAVCCDSNSQLLTFEINRYFENVDLSKKILSIKFQNALKQGDRAEPHGIGISDDRIIFTWRIDKRVTAGDGDVTFQIEFYEIVDGVLYSWQTKMQTFKVLPTLDVDGNIDMPSPTWVQDVTATLTHVKGYEVQSVGPYALAINYKTIAGMKGYYYSSVEFGDAIDEVNYGPCIITLSDKQWEAPAQAFEIDYSVGDVISMVNNSKYPDCGTITAIDRNVITVDKLPFNSIVDMIEKTGNIASDDYSVFVAEKPLAGDVPLGYGAFASGEDAIALERASAAFGRLTKALGQYGFAANRETIAAYCAAAFGHSTAALGQASFAVNKNTMAKDNYSFAAGFKTIATAVAQAVFGRYNIEDITKEFLFIIGNGTSETKRSNAFTVDRNGNVQCSGRIKAGDKDVATTEDIEKYMANTFATFKEIPLVAGITSELKIKPLYDIDADAFDIMVNDVVLNNKTPINESMRIATELLNAENTYIVFYSGEDIIYKCRVMRTIPNFGILFAI